MLSPIGFKVIIFMLCLAFQVVPGEQEMRCLQREREALLQFKALLDHHGMLSSWTTATDCCQWKGIRCSNLTGNIVSLDLHSDLYDYESYSRSSYISGDIHESLIELQQLKYLNLSSNYFPDSHIPEFLASLSNLRFLDLSHCYFSGKIPSQLGSLSHLKYLNLALNHLEGSIPPQLGNLSNLEYLDLKGSFFEGNLPSQLGNLSNIQEFYLEGSNYGVLEINDGGKLLSNLISLTHLYLWSIGGLNSSHTWLQEILNLPKLRELGLFHCSLSDHFILSLRPYQFNFSTSLLAFHLSGKTFTSPVIFPWVSNITSNLVELYLVGNNLEGSVSNHFGMAMNSLEHLDLSFNSFKGEVFKSFKNICTLHSLRMYENNLTEDLPQILHNLSTGCIRYSLQDLDLSYNKMVGSLYDLSAFLALKSLDLSQNQLDGKITKEAGIPKSFGNACALHTLDMTNNNLSDEFSMIIHHLSGCARYSLQELNLGENQINGKIPNSLGSLLGLQALLLRNNNLTHEIPFSLRHCTKLVKLDMSGNKLSGHIPAWIGSEMQELQILSLGRNHFSGILPLQICYLKSIQILDLSLNNLTGKIPACINNFTSMAYKKFSSNYGRYWYFVNTSSFRTNHSYELNAFLMWKGSEQMFKNTELSLLKGIDLSSNNFSEEVPVEIESLVELITLNLSRNNLIGKIPSNIGKLKSLEFLDLSRNQFVGSIPVSLNQIDRLAMLDLSYNHLTGIIPTGTQLQTFNASSYEHNLNLCGPPLEKCIHDEPTEAAIVKIDEYSLFGHEFYIGMVLGFVISFWTVFGTIYLSNLGDMLISNS
uniref:Uncharacterized protein n=1 Tax=Phaseolus vulgaris TaxID=3885 RepID=V7C141_PHAVU|nr:hypothetical protein PHAVU_004G084700g [Phaseolus vulgaris]ESW23887.1 hypothetical protein PHAVU_004G084700g [Phaseolus vulgaris]